MATSLHDLAREDERASMKPFASSARRRELNASAAFFQRVNANREAADPMRINLARVGLIDVIERWCRQHGYRTVMGTTGLTVQRGDEPAVVAGVFDTLHWDGQRITVAPN